MRTHPLAARLVAVASAAATVLAGTIVLTASPSQAATKPVYTFKTFAFGTVARTTTDGVTVTSDRTAYSHIFCSSRTGVQKKAFAAEAGAPADAPLVTATGLSSTSESFETADGVVGTVSVNRIADLVIGDPGGAHLLIEGLTTRSKAWADQAGRLKASSTVKSAAIQANTGVAEADGLLDGLGMDEMLEVIEAEGGAYVIPGLGTLRLGAGTPLSEDTGAGFARARATVLAVQLEAQPGTVVKIGHSSARIDRIPHRGTIGGHATGASVPSALGGVLKVGALGHRVLPCMGTDGNYLKADALGLGVSAESPLRLGNAAGVVMGVVRKDTSARAETVGSMASFSLGDRVSVRGIVGRAVVTRGARGAMRTSSSGTKIGELVIDGVPQEAPAANESIVVPGVAKLTFFTRERTRTSIAVTALRVELLDDSIAPVGTVIELGTAHARARGLRS